MSNATITDEHFRDPRDFPELIRHFVFHIWAPKFENTLKDAFKFSRQKYN